MSKKVTEIRNPNQVWTNVETSLCQQLRKNVKDDKAKIKEVTFRNYISHS